MGQYLTDMMTGVGKQTRPGACTRVVHVDAYSLIHSNKLVSDVTAADREREASRSEIASVALR